jgi:hypothetical protein
VQMRTGICSFVYATELGVVGAQEVAGTRLVWCLKNHLLIVDFPLVGSRVPVWPQ